jgi:hypothetical protein
VDILRGHRPVFMQCPAQRVCGDHSSEEGEGVKKTGCELTTYRSLKQRFGSFSDLDPEATLSICNGDMIGLDLLSL